MRILVLQLARFGDVFQTWPTLNALRRADPSAGIHVLVRSRFQEAISELRGFIVHALPTAEILRPVYEDGDEHAAMKRLTEFIEPLISLKFDRVINLTFSPLSSYLTDWIAGPETEVRGYTRHADGHFTVRDDASAYFYAQVGIDRANRYHVTDLFAAVAGAELADEDFRPPFSPASTREGIVVQLGASEKNKMYPAELWVEALNRLAEKNLGPITLIGSRDERALSETVAAKAAIDARNRVGETSLLQAMEIVARAKLLIAADSAPIHMASLTATPTLNLSSPEVRFWETGPLAPGSRVLYAENMARHRPEFVAQQAESMLQGTPAPGPCAIRDNRQDIYQLHELEEADFSWRLIEALYTGAPYPRTEDTLDRTAFQRLLELSELALTQLAGWNRGPREIPARILGQVDAMLTELGRLNPRVQPLIQWFETERLRIGPAPESDVLAKTESLFRDLFTIASVFVEPKSRAQTVHQAVELCQRCAGAAFECEMNSVRDDFQNLLTLLQELARHSTNVAGVSWSSVLQGLTEALEERDFIRLGDLLRWTLPAALETLPNPQETSADHVLS